MQGGFPGKGRRGERLGVPTGILQQLIGDAGIHFLLISARLGWEQLVQPRTATSGIFR
jgi:hypothetical protein